MNKLKNITDHDHNNICNEIKKKKYYTKSYTEQTK